MKGKATFTLAKAKTGEIVREFTEENLVTNAIKNILNPPQHAIVKNFSWSDFIKASMPIYKNLCGGIMLLGNTLEEDKDNILPNSDIIPIATAGDAYSGTSVTRGTLNQNETYETANGYHFTWDFATDKANGTIKCAALTSKMFGNSGFADADSNVTELISPMHSNTDSNATIMHAYGQYFGTPKKYTNIYLRKTDNTHVTLNVVKSVDMSAVRITDNPDMSVIHSPSEKITIELPITISDTYRPFVDGSTKKLYLFSALTKVADAVTSIDYAVIDLTDYTVSEKKTWTMNVATFTAYGMAIYDDKLYISDAWNLMAFSKSGTLVESESLGGTPCMWFSVVNGVFKALSNNNKIFTLYGGKWYKNYTKNSKSAVWPTDLKAPYCPFIDMRTLSYLAESSSNCYDPTLMMLSGYFATINNLSVPLEKTSEHTLKITYDITN